MTIVIVPANHPCGFARIRIALVDRGQTSLLLTMGAGPSLPTLDSKRQRRLCLRNHSQKHAQHVALVSHGSACWRCNGTRNECRVTTCWLPPREKRSDLSFHIFCFHLNLILNELKFEYFSDDFRISEIAVYHVVCVCCLRDN